VAVAAQPVPYRTSAATPAFEELTDHDGGHLFPIRLERMQCDRFEMAEFARRARDIGVSYIGICCGGGPHHVRAMAEALGRETPASRYSPDLQLHPVLGAPRADDAHEVMGGWTGASSGR
jgi:betaine-homocysteine S-methyltransferase